MCSAYSISQTNNYNTLDSTGYNPANVAITGGSISGLSSLQVSTGNTGLIIEPYTGGGYGAIYNASVTPGSGNEALISNGNITNLNGVTNSQMYVNGSVHMSCSTSGCSETGVYSTSGHSTSSTGNTPSISSGACGTGTNGIISGTDQDGKITIGATSTTSCAVTFGSSTWSAGPNACTFNPASSGSAALTVLPYISTLSASGFTISGSVLASTSFYYHCG